MGRSWTLTTKEVERLLYQGHHIVIHEGYALKLNAWLNDHPGGRLVIEHMVGRDATNEINIYHSSATIQLMHKYRIGKLSEPWINRTPPIRGGVFPNPDKEGAISEISGGPNPTVASNDSTEKRPSRDAAIPGHISSKGCEEWMPKYTEKSKKLLEKIIQSEVDNDKAAFPPLDLSTQSAIEAKYKALHERVKTEGFYTCHYSQYAKEVARYSTIFSLFALTLHYGWYLTSATLLGLFWHQIMFTAHDAGHRGITHNFVFDSLIGIFIADFCCGLSIGWWKNSHNVHHLITNDAEHDPDIQNIPLFSTCPTFFKSIRSSYYDFTFVWDKSADLLVPYQKYFYYPVMGLARFNLYILSMHHLLLGPKPSPSTRWIRQTEITGILFYWAWFGYGLVWRTLPDWPTRVAFVLISHIITMPLHVQITLSHWGMPTASLGETESFPQRQLRTTMDVDCPEWLDFIHGGLQFQAIHHLFPRVPRHNLRRLQKLVIDFCQETGIKYEIKGFVAGNGKVLSRLDEVSAQLELLLQCQKYMAETGESGLH